MVTLRTALHTSAESYPLTKDQNQAKSGECYNCGTKGHIARNCRKPKKLGTKEFLGKVDGLSNKDKQKLADDLRRKGLMPPKEKKTQEPSVKEVQAKVDKILTGFEKLSQEDKQEFAKTVKAKEKETPKEKPKKESDAEIVARFQKALGEGKAKHLRQEMFAVIEKAKKEKETPKNPKPHGRYSVLEEEDTSDTESDAESTDSDTTVLSKETVSDSVSRPPVEQPKYGAVRILPSPNLGSDVRRRNGAARAKRSDQTRGEKTASTKTEKGSEPTPEARSQEGEEAPKEPPKKSKVPDKVRIRESAERQGTPKLDKLSRDVKEFHKQRHRYEMLVPITIETLDTRKVRSVRALLDNGCMTT